MIFNQKTRPSLTQTQVPDSLLLHGRSASIQSRSKNCSRLSNGYYAEALSVNKNLLLNYQPKTKNLSSDSNQLIQKDKFRLSVEDQTLSKNNLDNLL